MESNQKVNKRILVLGSAPHSRTITAYTWDNLPKIFNIADYDMVILNMVPFLKKSFAHTYIEKTYFPLEQFARLLFSEGSEVIAIGVPEIETSGGVTRNLMGWLPKQLEMETRFLKLLYEQGEDVLEPVVREALQELGAQVTPAQQPGHEDGRLTDPFGRNGIAGDQRPNEEPQASRRAPTRPVGTRCDSH